MRCTSTMHMPPLRGSRASPPPWGRRGLVCMPSATRRPIPHHFNSLRRVLALSASLRLTSLHLASPPLVLDANLSTWSAVSQMDPTCWQLAPRDGGHVLGVWRRSSRSALIARGATLDVCVRMSCDRQREQGACHKGPMGLREMVSCWECCMLCRLRIVAHASRQSTRGPLCEGAVQFAILLGG